MKKKLNIWMIFNNLIAFILLFLGSLSIGLTLDLFKNYIHAKSEYNLVKLIENENENIKNNFKKMYEIKFENVKETNNNLTIFNYEKISNYKNFEEFRNELKNKNKSYLWNKKSYELIKNNLKSENFLNYKNDLLKKSSNENIKKFLNNQVYKPLTFKNTPENISLISGVFFVIFALIIFIWYWGVYFFKKINTKKQLNKS